MTFMISEYIFKNEVDGHLSHQEYLNSPGDAFCKFCCESADTIEFCKQYFPSKNNSNQPARESLPKIQNLLNAMIALLMGHFETYQKYLFAGCFERSILFEEFDASIFFKDIGFKKDVNIKSNHLLAYRGDSLSVGILLADNLTDWHNPVSVNSYFNAFGLKVQVFTNHEIELLRNLWQIRHSIVHTAATITKADAQKKQCKQLNDYAGKNIVFKASTMFELKKNLLTLVNGVNKRLEDAFLEKISPDASDQDKNEFKQFFQCGTSVDLR
ncbi:hypothetical protein Lepto7376_1221 [[Leptolyngbya] sp. PCC 7376]|uniref:hypothetical protein n=1 Tax=[Leptolyngbya] sp. PCC 7376 TaxID=111781 RepID=UPI00029EC454|nr:hypothetical protein [[Leptolyngbya] sp. PCC 7376]AFY37578.1 hypothetical protein Lepto7376_1221 [[Leptolyngbya] sp. PCC 7376]